MSASPLIEIHNLTKIYSNGEIDTVALKNVDLTVNAGEFVAIMGPSGSGKSTLLHILGLLDKPTKGDYFFEGTNVSNFSKEELAKLRNTTMGFVFQAFNLLPRTSVFENVKLPLVYSTVSHKEWRTLVEEAIESVGLTHRTDHLPNQLSGGEKQRVAIARALVNDPSVIFADEPTGNLDTKTSDTIMDIFTHLSKDKNKTVILITHEEDVAKYAERIIRLRDGDIEADNKRT